MSTATKQGLSKTQAQSLIYYLRRVVAKGPVEERELVALVTALERIARR